MNEKIVCKKLSDEEPILIDKKKQILMGITEEEYYEYIYLQQENKQLKETINKIAKNEEEIMYLVNKVAITTQNIEVKAVRDRLEDMFKTLKGESNEREK